MDHGHRGKAELLRVLKSRELLIDEIQDVLKNRELLIDELQDRARRLLGWRLLFEKRGSTYSSGRRDWRVVRTPLMTRAVAMRAARSLRGHCASRNVRVLRVYRKKHPS